MSMTNAERHDLHKGLEEFLGEKRANILMEHIPPVGWADLATKRDLDNLEERLRGEFRHEIGELRHEVGTLLTDQRYDMRQLRSELQLQIAGLRSELHHGTTETRSELQLEIAGLRSELHHGTTETRSELQLQISDLRASLAGQQLRHTIALVGILGTLMAVLNAFN